MATAPGPILPLGEIIAWQSAGTSHTDLVAALKAAGLDEKLARDLLPRHAFSRACRKLSDERIIRVVGEDKDSIQFQFTRESKVGHEYQYNLEAMLKLWKADGDISGSHAGLCVEARDAFNAAMAARTASDVSTIVQRVLTNESDLFAIRPQGGCYFVPQRASYLIDKCQQFLGGIGGTMVRFAVSQGNPETERSVKVSIAAGLQAMIEEHQADVDAFGVDTRPDTIKRAAEKIRTSRFKVDAYAALLGEAKEKLESSLKAAAAKLRAKVVELGKSADTSAAGPVVPASPAGGMSTPADVPEGVAARVPVYSKGGSGSRLFDNSDFTRVI